MSKVFEKVITVKGKRPANATPDLARQLRAKGMKVKEIAAAWDITPTRVYAILKQKG